MDNIVFNSQVLFVETFLPTTLAELQRGGGSAYMTVPASTPSGVVTVDLNSTAAVGDDVLVEITLWPQWGAREQTRLESAARISRTSSPSRQTIMYTL